ncbi:MAG: hypothetical protein RL660_1918 [Bacteroidota bacterium]|jgi:hypothetical protein
MPMKNNIQRGRLQVGDLQASCLNSTRTLFDITKGTYLLCKQRGLNLIVIILLSSCTHVKGQESSLNSRIVSSWANYLFDKCKVARMQSDLSSFRKVFDPKSGTIFLTKTVLNRDSILSFYGIDLKQADSILLIGLPFSVEMPTKICIIDSCKLFRNNFTIDNAALSFSLLHNKLEDGNFDACYFVQGITFTNNGLGVLVVEASSNSLILFNFDFAGTIVTTTHSYIQHDSEYFALPCFYPR